MKSNSFNEIPSIFLIKWQEIADLIASIINIPAALIMKVEDEFMEVFISSNTENNPYHVGNKEEWSGLYCETVIKSQEKLIIPNALKDKDWNKNPDIKLGMIAYLGFPINFPNNQPFGTICVLDNKDNSFSPAHEKLMLHFKKVIELDLTLMQTFEIKTIDLSQTISEQQSQLLEKNIELNTSKEKAEESDRLKSAFLANMSHEIRTPMNGILGFAELLKRPDLKSETRHQYIEIIEKSGQRMLNIINDIVDISKIEAGLMKLDLKETNVYKQIEDIYTFFKPQAKAKGMKIFFKNSLPAKEAIIKTDREKVYAILANLVNNAIKYTSKGSIEFGYNLKTDSKSGALEFYVKDTGIGIPKDRQESIFDRFIQADIANKMAHQGAGLGLAITKAYVEMLSGKIWVESEEGKGSIFYFTLPYNTEPAAETIDRQLQPSGENKTVSKLKILVAEDDEVSEMLLDETVKIFAKEILKARTGVGAVEACRDNPDTDLILMDVRMPEMDGYEAIQQIREFNKQVIIIAQTSYSQTGDREKLIESGCNDYLAKPINEKELQAMIQKYFGK